MTDVIWLSPNDTPSLIIPQIEIETVVLHEAGPPGPPGGDATPASIAEVLAGVVTSKVVTPYNLSDALPTVPLGKFGTLDMTGATDKTALLQNAADALVGIGKALELPPGIIRVEGDLTVPSDIQWVGPRGNRYKTGAGGCNLRYYGTGTMITIDGAYANTLTQNIHGRIEGARISYHGGGSAAVMASLDNLNDFNFEELYVLGFDVGIDCLGDSAAVHGNRCWMSASTVALRGHGSTDMQWVNSQFAGTNVTAGRGVDLLTCASPKFIGCRFQTSGDCNAYFDNCNHGIIADCHSDTAVGGSRSGNREGFRFKNCQHTRMSGMLYGNLTTVVIENTDTDFDGTFGMKIDVVVEGNDSITILQNGGTAKNVDINVVNGSSIASSVVVSPLSGGAGPIQGLNINAIGAGLGVYGLQHTHRDTLRVRGTALPDYCAGGLVNIDGGTFRAPFYVNVGDVSGRRVALPSDQAPPTPTGDMTVVVLVDMDDPIPGTGIRQTLASQFHSTGNQRGWELDIIPSGPSFRWSANGTSTSAGTTADSATLVPGITDGVPATFWLKVWHDVDNGSGGNTTWFSTAPYVAPTNGIYDPSTPTWAALTSVVKATPTASHFAAAAEIALNGIVAATSQRFAGKVRYLDVRTGGSSSPTPSGTIIAQWQASHPGDYRDAFGGVWNASTSNGALWGGQAPRTS